MKKQLALAAALFLGLAALSARAEEAGTLKLVKGDVRVVDARGERSVQPGDHIAVADKLITGPDGSASMVMRDGTTVVLGPKSRLELKDFSFDASTQKGSMLVSLVQGSLRMITGLIAKVNPGAVSVTTKSATIGVRGTDFIVQADE
jgi:hypothetical protein